MDYTKLGFKCGLEVHQQLDTAKLFCACVSVLRSDEPDLIVERKLHPVAGESGEVDVAAKHEAEKNLDFFYQYYKDSNCLVELDEEPPHEINSDALGIALQVALLLNCRIFPITQIMRKTVIDGSNTSGFQRTVLIAHGGYVETASGKVGIETIGLEEDAARIVSNEKGKKIYRLDRLGIPLVEISTSPDIKTPEQAKEVALYIGNVLRSCRVKRGLGTIRQDVNVSIKGGARTEIKGMQDMKIFVKAIENEIGRQSNLIENKKEVVEGVRNVLPDATTEFLRPIPGAARMYPETDLMLLRISRDRINEVKKNLPQLRTDIAEELKREGLDSEMIGILLKENRVDEFRSLLEVLNNPKVVAKSLLIYSKEIAKKFAGSVEDTERISELLNSSLDFILGAVAKKKISEAQIKSAMERIAEGKSFEDAIVFEKEDEGIVEEKILKIINEKPGLNANAYMGLVMKEFKGKIDGKKAMEIIKKYVGQN